MREIKILNRKAENRDETSKPSTRYEVRRIMRALMTNVNSPSVKRLIGSVSKRRTGLTMALMTPSTIATIRADLRSANVTPGTISDPMYMASAFMRSRMISIICIIVHPNFLSMQ